MKVCIKNNDIVIENATDFKLADIFDCGQCFRFNPDDDGGYIGTAYDKTVRITQNGDTVTLHNTSEADFDSVWRRFLDLDRDYTVIKKELTKGSSSLLVLSVIGEKDMYGYEMIETLEKKSNNIFQLKAGTLYPGRRG